MIQALQDADLSLFFFVNLKLAHAFLDHFMVWITTKQNWYIPGGLLVAWLLTGGGKKGRMVVVLVFFGILFSDQISSSILKPLTERLRPCKALEGFRLLVHCGSKYGFPSSHATNIAAIGTIFISYYRKWLPFWLPMIFFMGISRVYVGVHYPSDVLAGWVLGAAIGAGLIMGLKRLQPKYQILRF